jgi:P27 family predicted phage terminase small subunit
MGAKPKPTSLKKLAGNPGRRPLNENEPQPPSEVPTCPKHLNTVARREWTRISRALVACGLLTSVDRAALTAYCVAWSHMVEAETKLSSTGMVIQSPTGYPIVNPFLGIWNRSSDIMHKFCTEFGLTPSARVRLSVNPDAVKKNNWDEYAEFVETPASGEDEKVQ